MRKYRIIFILCVLIVIGFFIYTTLPRVELTIDNINKNKEGQKKLSQEELRATTIGERYIPDEITEYNKNVVHSDDESDDNHLGDVGDGEVYINKTPIYGGEAVARYFKNSSNYYTGEIKLEEAFYNYIPELLSATVNMTNTELKGYFESNADIIERRLGIVNADEFVMFIGSMDRLNGKKYVKIDIPSNAITENYTNLAINFLVEFTLEDGSRMAPVSVSISHLKSTSNQSAPYIQIVGLYKSQRLE